MSRPTTMSSRRARGPCRLQDDANGRSRIRGARAEAVISKETHQALRFIRLRCVHDRTDLVARSV